MKSVNKPLQHKDTNPESPAGFVVKAVHNIAQSRDIEQRFKELKVINARLEKSAIDQSEKLAEVVATNAKFLSIIAHDLRSPFTSIIGVLELLKDSYNDFNIKEVEKYIRMATNSANGTLNLLENLLSWTTAQNKAIFFSPVRINLHELIIEEIESLYTYAIHKLITLDHSVTPKLFVAADVQMVKTILRNLLNNAIKYSYVGGEIMVSAVENDQFVEITVQDEGIGMKRKVQNELFIKSEFHSTRGTNNENGTGLGLILCKEFVEKHGGSIWIESESGKGCKVKFTLPHYI
jgi:signal transduction histidine kinase